MGFQQNVVYARRGSLFLDAFVRIAGNQNDRGAGMAVPQQSREITAAHRRRRVVDHAESDRAGAVLFQQASRYETCERQNRRFQAEIAAGSEDVGVVVNNADNRY